MTPGTYSASCGCPVFLGRLGRAGTVETWVSIVDHDDACPDNFVRASA